MDLKISSENNTVVYKNEFAKNSEEKLLELQKELYGEEKLAELKRKNNPLKAGANVSSNSFSNLVNDFSEVFSDENDSSKSDKVFTSKSSSESGGVSTSKSSSESERKDALDNIFTEASEKFGVDKSLLLAIAKQESDFHSDAVSSSGAIGVMQLMPSTAKAMGVSNAYDAYENIFGGAKLISNLLSKYNGDISLALAAYNSGTGTVSRYGGIPPLKGVQNYISNVLSNYEGYMNA